ncbi:hypothetical protein BDQ17DRAFT_1324155 [Cyathus striatus]|nr:hypothetical protein BDQ17DRAFT_1324155 [Cyathus striatus]
MHQFDKPPEKVLDLGCGMGYWAIEAAKQWPQSTIVGLDVAKIQPPLALLRDYKPIASRVQWINENLLSSPGGRVATLIGGVFRVMKPGAVIEIIEEDLLFPCATPPHRKSRFPPVNIPSLELTVPSSSSLTLSSMSSGDEKSLRSPTGSFPAGSPLLFASTMNMYYDDYHEEEEMHLAKTVNTIKASKEAIWHEYARLYPKGREAFETDWKNWENDMTDRIGMRDCLVSQLSWSEPAGERPDWRVWRGHLEKEYSSRDSGYASLSGEDPEDLCRSVAGFVGLIWLFEYAGMGVKSLWTLLTPVGRPVQLETVEGKVMAIDSSIWIYQFQATMRDKEGKPLMNAHVLGFLRRIAKLLFYGIKPVFVFDGGAPDLKRSTLNERRKKRAGAASSHVALAQKLLAAQMRKEAVLHAKKSQSSKAAQNNSNAPTGSVSLDDNTVYLEDVDGSSPKTPKTPKNQTKPTTPPSSTNNPKFYDHDPYKLPAVNLEEKIAEMTTSAAPDARLATEEEMQAFIDQMKPEDFDVTSPAFRELPTEVQYEIIGDLRLKSRQTSYARLQNMLKTSKTALDFSKQQIMNLRQRNHLTQQLLMTTDSIGKAHISIPVRIASERNREYVLMKNEGESGGWILGIRDQCGTAEKPIEIDQDSDKEVIDVNAESDDDDMEEVEVPVPAPYDPDLHDELPVVEMAEQYQDDEDVLAFAIQESMDHAKDVSQRKVSNLNLQTPAKSNKTFHEEDYYFAHTRLETALSFANMGHSRTPGRQGQSGPSLLGKTAGSSARTPAAARRVDSEDEQMQTVIGKSTVTEKSTDKVSSKLLFGKPSLLAAPEILSTSTHETKDKQTTETSPRNTTSGLLFGKPVMLAASNSKLTSTVSYNSEAKKLETVASSSATVPPPATMTSGLTFGNPTLLIAPSTAQNTNSDSVETPLVTTKSLEAAPSLTDADIPKSSTAVEKRSASVSEFAAVLSNSEDEMEEVVVLPTSHEPVDPRTASPPDDEMEAVFIEALIPQPVKDPLSSSIESSQPISSPVVHALEAGPSPILDEDGQPDEQHREDWDAAHEMDPHAEEGEFARFMSHVKGKDLDDVRREIDDEIKVLNEQRKAAMRDSDDVTQQMVSQIMIMLRYFGIPYITAPMEAEAQCAELVSIGLVDGVITDDSDVFLFGAARVYKNMFNQSKTVECFLLSDLERELGLDRDTLVRLAYLLGSDYVDGLSGVGPVVAMELLKEFPGEDGLYKFKEWWSKKKKFKSLYLAEEWPNPVVREAYYHPMVDSSDEPFKWGLPDLDGLRDYLRDELSWGKSKVDELLLPIIQRMNRRGQEKAANKQSNLNEFLDLGAGSGTYAPKQRHTFTSKRLQNGSSKATEALHGSESESVEEEEPLKKKRKQATREARKGKGKSSTTTGNGAKTARGGKRVSANRKGKSKAKAKDDDEDDESGDTFSGGEAVDIEVPLKVELRPRPKPRPINKSKQSEVASDVEL